MIPKVIHLCWLSGDPFPADIQVCLESWGEHLSDYEVWLWGKAPENIKINGYRLTVNGPQVIEKPFDIDSSRWTREAFENKKYAFAADYIRLYALYTYGGIYLDADVLVYKSFNCLLSLPYFVGADKVGSFEAAVIGAEKDCPWIFDIWKRYENRPFVKADGSFDQLSLPVVFKKQLVNAGYSFKKLFNNEEYCLEDKLVKVFSEKFFNSRDHLRVCKTTQSYCAHNYLGSWTNAKKDLKTRIKSNMPACIMNAFFRLSHSTWNRHKFDDIKIPF